MSKFGARRHDINQRLAGRKSIVLSAIKKVSEKLVKAGKKGAMAADIKKFIATEVSGFKISMETLRETIEDLEIEGFVCRVDNNKRNFKRYLPKED